MAVVVRVAAAAERIRGCLAPLGRGPSDPTLRFSGSVVWRAVLTPQGPGLESIAADGGDAVVTCHGPGAHWLADTAGDLLGCADDPSGFDPRTHPLVARAARSRPGFRIGRTGLMLDALVPAAIEQRVTGREAFAAYARLVRRHGLPVPVQPDHPASGLYVVPPAAVWASLPDDEWLLAGVDLQRRRVVREAAVRGGSLERLATGTRDVDAALRSLPGVGPWTSAHVRQRALGDPDAWTIGDYHVGRHLTYALTGEALGDDAAAELLEPFRGHRHRVERLVLAAYPPPPRHGPRRSLPTHLPR